MSHHLSSHYYKHRAERQVESWMEANAFTVCCSTSSTSDLCSSALFGAHGARINGVKHFFYASSYFEK